MDPEDYQQQFPGNLRSLATISNPPKNSNSIWIWLSSSQSKYDKIVVSDDCLLHETACNTKYTGKLVFTHCMAIVVIQFQIQIRLNRALNKSIFVN